jgi:phosphoadenosine phosphosulfate reductase
MLTTALQFSGGKDSLATLYLMRPRWSELVVYWMNTGDPFPETVETAARVRAMVPHFVEVKGDVHKQITEHGIPTDLLPATATPFGIAVSGRGVKMQDRYSCCQRALMAPLHQRMKADGITTIIRGQKHADHLKGPYKDGDVADGFKLVYPLEGWTDEDVFKYLASEGVELPRFYQTMNSSPDCLNCSAWWGEGRAQYLKEYHPASHMLYQQRLKAIKIAVVEHIDAFSEEVK